MQAKPTLSHSRQAEIRKEALRRAVTGQSLSNYPAIFAGFQAKGIPEDQIKPRENIFSYAAWKALGRFVRRGEHGVRIATVLETSHKEKDKATGEEKIVTRSRPWSVVVFHISQTSVNGKGGDNGE